MVSREIAIGVVGAGFGRYGLIPAFRRDQRCHIVALCTASTESIETYTRELAIPRGFTDFAQMLATTPMDAVAIAAPPRAQGGLARMALEAGIAVFAEKPLAQDLKTAKELLACAEKQGVPHAIDFMYPELVTWQRARELIKQGTIGEMRHLIINWHLESYDNARGNNSWKTDSQEGGGALSHFGSHTFYNLEWLGGTIVSLTSQLSTAPDIQAKEDTLATIAVMFENGASGSISVSTAALHGVGHTIEMYGSKGTLLLQNTTADPIMGFALYQGLRGESGLSEIMREPSDQRTPAEDHRVAPVARLASRFLDALEGIKTDFPTFKDGVRIQSLIDSARNNTII